MAQNTAPPQNGLWTFHWGTRTLSHNPSESAIRKAIQRELYSTIPLEIRPETRMAGNQEGMGFIDTLEKKLKAHTRDVEDIVQAVELLRYLPSGKRVDASKRNEIVHGGHVKFDLRFLESVKQDFLRSHDIQHDDLLIAFRNRYGELPSAFPGDFPEDVASIINLRSCLVHLYAWKKLSYPKDKEFIEKRESLKQGCSEAIRRWFDQTPPYSTVEVEATLKILRENYDRDRSLLPDRASEKTRRWRWGRGAAKRHKK